MFFDLTHFRLFLGRNYGENIFFGRIEWSNLQQRYLKESQQVFHFHLNLQKWVQNYDPEHLLFRWLRLMVGDHLYIT